MDYTKQTTNLTETLTITGHLEAIKFKNEENHYTVAQFHPDDIGSAIIITGYLVGVKEGDSLDISGNWERHSKYGQQFRVLAYEPLLPTTIAGIKAYLKTLNIKGLSSKKINTLVKEFNEETLAVIESAPEKIESIKGFGRVLSANIVEAWEDHSKIRRLISFLQKYEVPASYSADIFKTWGGEAVDRINENPFILYHVFPEMPFGVIDLLAGSLGFDKNATQRIEACILYLLEVFASDGNVCTPRETIQHRCPAQFGIKPALVTEVIDQLRADGRIVLEKSFDDPDLMMVYAEAYHRAEEGIANTLQAMTSIPAADTVIDEDDIIEEVLQRLAIKLTDEQLHVLEDIITHKVAVITGGPGTGKTTLVRSVTAIFKKLGKTVLLAAPTGRAARRLGEVTGEDASTIHKMLQYNIRDGKFEKNRDDTLDVDALIVDEASMVDVLLMYHLLNAIPVTASVVFVGDIFQLPSVGPGTVLSDLIKSERFTTFELTKIFRQVEESPIIVNSHRVRNGQPLSVEKVADQDALSEFYFIETANPQTVSARVVELCSNRIPEKYGYDPITEIQVLTPMHKGDVGTISLNTALQETLNPGGRKIESFGRIFKEGDKVMHLKNNYEKEVFNGDIGSIEAIDKKLKTLSVDYYGKSVEYEFDELNELSLAYAISVHKSQGSEYPAVVIPITTQHYALLQRNLLYTGMTRGKKLVILIGTERAFNIALNNDRPRLRLSGLEGRLKNL